MALEEARSKMDKFQTTSNVTGKRIRQYLEKNKRFDGRKLDEFRNIEVEVGVSKKAEGSARVRIGKTEVIVGVKLGLGTPYSDSPNKGNLMTTVELTPLSSPRFEAGPPKFRAIEIGRVIDRGIRESKVINFEGLCIKEGEKVWTIFVDIYSMNDDGNLMDAAGIGAVVALKNAKMPKYDEKTGTIVYGELTDKKLPLKKDIPISITAHKIGNSIIVDPTQEEEDLSETRVTIGFSDGIISSMQKGESTSITPEEMGEVFEIIEKSWKDVFKKIEKFVK
ncbi:RNA-binding protein [Candidatus Pacearchaeota archaeon]|jgi:exosome complex component RRP42|nr:RNA-binding protein [Candidatus Pacearchaeota archaeon]